MTRMSARLSAIVILAGAIAAGLLVDSAEDDARTTGRTVEAGVAMPAARPEPTLSSTWYCAGGSAVQGGVGDHVLLMANPSDRRRTATVTILTGNIAPTPAVLDAGAPTTTASTTTTVAAATTVPTPRSVTVPLPSRSRVAFRLADHLEAQLAGAIVEVDGGEIAVEHEINASLGRATAPCSTTASLSWTFPWGVTARGSRELLVFMNPFPDDATVDIEFATDQGVRETSRFVGFVVPGRSVIGAYVDEDFRRDQVSAQITVRGGRVVVDRIQSFSGVDGREGITLGLGAPTPAITWMFPEGYTGPGILEQIVVYNPTDRVAEVEVEVRLDDPDTNGIPEPFELTASPGRYVILDLHAEDRMVPGVGHSTFVRSLNGVPVVAERVVAAVEGAPRRGVGSTLGAPLGAPLWYISGGGTSAERDEFLTLLNVSIDEPVTYSVIALANGQELAIQGLQDRTLEPGARASIRVGDHVQREDLPLVVIASRAIVAERGLYRVGGDGLSHAMGIPLGSDIVVPDPIEG